MTRYSLVVCALCFAAFGQQPAASPKPGPGGSEKETEEGIPVTSDLVRKECGSCHPSDEKQRMTRISHRRTTPEGWQQTIKRMVSLNNVKLDPETARQILKYLANQHGVAPAEAKPGAFEVEKRLIDYKYAGDSDTEQTCIKCHSFGRVLLQRRSKREWELLIAMHRGYYPLIDNQAYRRMGPPQTQPGPDGRPPDNRHPMDKAIAHLSAAFPLNTPEWSEWSVNWRNPKLEGRWLLTGYQTGKGPVFGEVTIKPNPSSKEGDEFVTEASYTYARSKQTVRRQGKVNLYTGYQWRGRSIEVGHEDAAFREVLFVDRNQREITGRWFTGAYDETGIDVKLVRVGRDPLISGVFPSAAAAGSPAREVRIFGANLPVNPSVSDFDFGPGVVVRSVTSGGAASLAAVVEVSKEARIGVRDLAYSGSIHPRALTVYDKVDAIKVRPQSGLSRLGGVRFPKMLQQFEAIGYSNGPDGKPDTKDDIEIGMVDVAWSVEEYTATFGDDDLRFVGSVNDVGLFTPNVDGPNANRSGNRNNMGDIWVVASHQPADKSARPLRARALLIVTVPLYLRFDQPEVGQ
jgi:quinohemoprotein amine dehydrogenase